MLPAWGRLLRQRWRVIRRPKTQEGRGRGGRVPSTQLAVLGDPLGATSGKLVGKHLRANAVHPDLWGGVWEGDGRMPKNRHHTITSELLLSIFASELRLSILSILVHG